VIVRYAEYVVFSVGNAPSDSITVAGSAVPDVGAIDAQPDPSMYVSWAVHP